METIKQCVTPFDSNSLHKFHFMHTHIVTCSHAVILFPSCSLKTPLPWKRLGYKPLCNMQGPTQPPLWTYRATGPPGPRCREDIPASIIGTDQLWDMWLPSFGWFGTDSQLEPVLRSQPWLGSLSKPGFNPQVELASAWIHCVAFANQMGWYFSYRPCSALGSVQDTLDYFTPSYKFSLF